MTAGELEWIYTDGVFDLVHSGHFNALRQASLLGDCLCVGVNSDEEALTAKGALPILDEDERERILGACQWVERTLPRAPYETSLSQLLDVAKCHYVAHGDDLVIGASGQDCYKEPRAAGLFRVFRRTPGISSTAVLCRILQACVKLGYLTETDFQEDPRDSLFPIAGPCDTRRLLEFIGDRRAQLNRMRSQELLQTQAEKDRPRQLKIVYCAGLFDIIRGAHVDFLEKVKSFGNYLLVGLYGDEVSTSLWGKKLPILSLTERMMSLYALRVVDEIVLNAPIKLNESFLSRYGVNVVVFPQALEADIKRFPKLSEFEPDSFVVENVETKRLLAPEVNSILPTLAKVAQAHRAKTLPNLDYRREKNAKYSEMGTGVPMMHVEL